MLKLQTIGYLGQDCQIRNHDGKQVLNFNVASTKKVKLTNGEEKEHTTWVNCSYWTSSEKLAEFLKKRYISIC